MCGANDAVCLHGDCVVETADGAAYEYCRCDDMYSGSQCSFREELLYWELPVTCGMMLVMLGISIFVTGKTLEWLRFSRDKRDAFAFPRKWKSLPVQSIGAKLLRGTWSGVTRRGLPTKPTRNHIVENTLIALVVFLEIVPWVQLIALLFLPVVPWPKPSRRVAETLRLSLLYPLWSHLEPSKFPILMLYLALGFVPGALLVACILGAKRFPLFKPQPKNSPAEDVCTLVLRLYSEWFALPVMIGLLFPFECGVIGYSKTEGSGMTVPTLSTSCFTLLQGEMVAAGSFMFILYCITSSAIVIQMNCEASPPEPTLWTHVRYTKVAHILKAPLAMVNGIRLAGAVMAFWTSLLATVASLVDDPGATIIYETWSLGAIAISAISLPGLFLYHSEDFLYKLVSSAKDAGLSSIAEATKQAKTGRRPGRRFPNRASKSHAYPTIKCCGKAAESIEA
ncbi:Hypothetical protein PHPALM_18084 [Phytophthora palmivora]|uniref:Uncharacterized protein n=1 Tax=Phytophthora palmivora TaxID=4796 RepID=A0A2P4XKP8_9STRA|nr:Hypothetical protein PHPALM_18084 [Phytophthora palmivora]